MNTTGAIFDFGFLLQSIPQILAYLPVTLLLTGVSACFGLLFGFATALSRYYRVPVLSQILRVIVSIMRGTPVMCQLLLSYYGIPVLLKVINAHLGSNLSVNAVPPMAFAIVTLSLNSGAYMSETLRSCMMSVDAGQIEACTSMNLTRWQTIRYVVLPQSIVTALAPLGNSIINLLKETSLVFNITVVEMMTEAQIIGASSYRFFEVYIVVTVIYFILCWILERVIALLERHFRSYERGQHS